METFDLTLDIDGTNTPVTVHYALDMMGEPHLGEDDEPVQLTGQQCAHVRRIIIREHGDHVSLDEYTSRVLHLISGQQMEVA